MTRPLFVGRPLPVQAPTAFVRIRPRGVRICGESRRVRSRRCVAAAVIRR